MLRALMAWCPRGAWVFADPRILPRVILMAEFRTPRLSSRNRFALLMSVQLERSVPYGRLGLWRERHPPTPYLHLQGALGTLAAATITAPPYPEVSGR